MFQWLHHDVELGPFDTFAPSIQSIFGWHAWIAQGPYGKPDGFGKFSKFDAPSNVN
jgi:hypothetical protein